MKIAIIADIHSNIFALRSVVEDLDKENVDFILVVGDIVGYYYWPNEVIKMLMSDKRFICIRGNHEDILKKTLSCKKSAKFYEKKYGLGYEFCKNQLSDDQIQWLDSLPVEISIKLGRIKFYMAHGALHSTDSYLYPNVSSKELLLNYSNCEFTIFGHTHYPFIHTHNNKYLLNPGSVGQPRDVGGLASYVIINDCNSVVQFKRRAFDVLPIINATEINNPELKYLSEIMLR